MSGQGSKNKIIIIAIISVLFIAAGVFAFALIYKLNRRSREIAARSTSAVVTTAATTTTETTTEATTTTTTEETTDDGKTLEEVMDPAAVKEEVDKLKAKEYFKKTYKDYKIEASGNTYLLKYYYKQVFSAKQMASIKNSLEASGIKDKLDSFKDSAEKKYGKRPDKVVVIYYNGDGTEIVTIEG